MFCKRFNKINSLKANVAIYQFQCAYFPIRYINVRLQLLYSYVILNIILMIGKCNTALIFYAWKISIKPHTKFTNTRPDECQRAKINLC